VGAAGEAITVSVTLRSEDFVYVPVPNPIFHYFEPNKTVPVTIVGEITGEYPGVADIERFLALEFDLSGGTSDDIGIDVGFGSGVTGLFDAGCTSASCFDGDVTPFTSDELFGIFEEVFAESSPWEIFGTSAVFVGPEGDLLFLGDLDWSLVNPNDPPVEQVAIAPTFDVQLKPGTIFSIEEGATSLNIDGGFGASFPVLDVLAEFDLSMVPPDANVTSAALTLDTTGGSGNITLEAMGYAGDGLASTADALAVETLIGSQLITSVGGDVTIALDADFIESLLGQASHLGLRLTSATAGPFVNLASIESTTRDPAMLVLEYSVPDVGLSGDYNGDGIVDAADFTVWRDHLGTNFDLNGNGDDTAGSAGVVDQADYELWKLHFGETGPNSGSAAASTRTAVPEPGSLSLLLLAALAMGSGRSIRR
jgi:hypothetical protein